MDDAARVEIGARLRGIRRRRGMALDTAAGLAKISKSYLSMLETGQRRLDRRGLLEDLAAALGCAVSDITGQPYQLPGRASAEAMTALAAVSQALHDCTLDDVALDRAARPIAVLAGLAHQASVATDESQYDRASRGLGDVLVELHLHVVTGDGDTRRTALFALAEACMAACGAARQMGNVDLAVLAATRCREVAAAVDDPALQGFAAMSGSGALMRAGARHRAGRVLSTALSEVMALPGPRAGVTATAEAAGMLHLASAQLAAREGRADDADTHIGEAAALAALIGEQNAWLYHFGPSNVAAWGVAIGVELGRGPAAAQQVRITPERLAALSSADRRAGLHLDMARAYAQTDDGSHDITAVRHLDEADRIAPLRIRHDPMARELVELCADRARRRTWEINSLRHRLGIT